MLKLIQPSVDYKASFIAAAWEFKAEGLWRYADMDIDDVAARFGEFVQSWLDHEKVAPRPDWVPETILWGVDDSEFVGRISIRHMLTESLREFGGHIGYEVRPSKRRMGYGTGMLRLALPEVLSLDINPVMITCDVTNIGSRKIIEANGGVLQDIIKLDYRPTSTMRWWITIDEKNDAGS